MLAAQEVRRSLREVPLLEEEQILPGAREENLGLPVGLQQGRTVLPEVLAVRSCLGPTWAPRACFQQREGQSSSRSPSCMVRLGPSRHRGWRRLRQTRRWGRRSR